jgi:hypothetical protein
VVHAQQLRFNSGHASVLVRELELSGVRVRILDLEF